MDGRHRHFLSLALCLSLPLVLPSGARAADPQAAAPSPSPTIAPSPSPAPATPVAEPSPVVGGRLRAGANPRPWANRNLPPLASGGVGTDGKPAADAEDSAAVRRVIEQLPPEERAVFLRNFQRWAQLTTEERQTLRRQADERRQRIMEEMETALRESGLHLDEDRRQVFMLRYRQERRKLELELQEKIATERARRTPEIVERLKREFETPPPVR